MSRVKKGGRYLLHLIAFITSSCSAKRLLRIYTKVCVVGAAGGNLQTALRFWPQSCGLGLDPASGSQALARAGAQVRAPGLPKTVQINGNPATTVITTPGYGANGSASDSRPEGWEFESLCPHFSVLGFLFAPCPGRRDHPNRHTPRPKTQTLSTHPPPARHPPTPPPARPQHRLHSTTGHHPQPHRS